MCTKSVSLQCGLCLLPDHGRYDPVICICGLSAHVAIIANQGGKIEEEPQKEVISAYNPDLGELLGKGQERRAPSGEVLRHQALYLLIEINC